MSPYIETGKDILTKYKKKELKTFTETFKIRRIIKMRQGHRLS